MFRSALAIMAAETASGDRQRRASAADCFATALRQGSGWHSEDELPIMRQTWDRGVGL